MPLAEKTDCSAFAAIAMLRMPLIGMPQCWALGPGKRSMLLHSQECIAALTVHCSALGPGITAPCVQRP